MQIAQTFNVNATKFILVSLGVWLVKQGGAKGGVEHLVAVMLVLPYVLFAPTAGWLSDRFAKNRVIRWMAVAQVVILILLVGALHAGHLAWAIAAFALLASQAALLSPAKLGIVKEQVGARRLGFASGVMEGTVILAILSGQIIGAKWFDRWGISKGIDGWKAAWVPVWWLVAFSGGATLLAFLLRRTRPLSARPFSFAEATSHIRDVKEIWAVKKLRLAALGVGFFWGFGGFINLSVLEIAEDLHHGGPGTFDAFADLWAMAVIGIAVGSVGAGFMIRRRLELGLTPIGAIIMAAGAFGLAYAEPFTLAMKVMLVVAGLGGAVFLVPLQTLVQDLPTEEKRGAVLSASNLLNNLLGILAVGLQFALKYLGYSMKVQFVVLGLLIVAVIAITFRYLTMHFIRVCGLVLVRIFYKVRVVNAQNVPVRGGVLLLPNHVSFADAIFLTAASPRPVRFVMSSAFMRNKWIRIFATMFKTVPISGGRKAKEALETAARMINEEEAVVCIFPEGQITRTGCVNELKHGFERIAKAAGCPVVPVYLDGAWGSIFSYERGRFFKKTPYRIPFGITVGFAPPQSAEAATVETVRPSMLAASASTLADSMRSQGWGQRKPNGKLKGVPGARRFDNALPEQCSQWWANGSQIADVNALQSHQAFGYLADDPVLDKLPGLMGAFAAIQGANPKRLDQEIPKWVVGGHMTREWLLKNGGRADGVCFFDFEADVIEEIPNVLHCPCLVQGDVVIAMSMPDPPMPMRTSDVQLGRKEGAFGRLLPGFAYEQDGECVRLKGPSLPEAGLLLPQGLVLDEEGFVTRKIQSEETVSVSES